MKIHGLAFKGKKDIKNIDDIFLSVDEDLKEIDKKLKKVLTTLTIYDIINIESE